MKNDLISRQWLIECVDEGWIKFDTEKDENRFIHLVRDIAPSAQPKDECEYWDSELSFCALHRPSAQPSTTDTNVGGTSDTISRQAAIKAICEDGTMLERQGKYTMTMAERKQKDADILDTLPPAQPNLSEAYSKAVFTWLMDYQTRAAELKGRYTPYEVLSWVINDWRKEHERSD